MSALSFLRVDIEPTNRCNADCYFCPREMTPDEGMLKPDVFASALMRTLELQDVARERLDMTVGVTLCGLGEPLINKHTPDYIDQIRTAGLDCTLSSNGALLDERRGRALLDAGLQKIHLNIGERDEGYEDIYKLPWERTRDNVIAFQEMAGDDCEVHIVLVNHRRDRQHQKGMREYWQGLGIKHFLPFEIMNRGGSLVVEDMDYNEAASQEAAELFGESVPPCLAPFVFPFVGYDGQIYLCCSDWTKTAPFGSVHDTSFVDSVLAKLDFVEARAGICSTCNIDPINQVVDKKKAVDAGEASAEQLDELISTLHAQGEQTYDIVEKLRPLVNDGGRRTIPVRAL